ncbi:MAG: hypothetical protein ACHQ1E_10740 [Ktedonobacterales bacterium]|jgi:hypothetical protein
MITDLTASMQTALSDRQQWVAAYVSGDLERDLEVACQTAQLRVFRRWTNDEAWAFLKDAEERPAACLWRRAPFGFVTTAAPAELRAFLTSWQAQLIEVADWQTSLFSLDLEDMEPYRLWLDWHTIPEAVSPSEMTLLDLVYATH